MNKTLRIYRTKNNSAHLIMIDKIMKISEEKYLEDGTLIHLTNGEIIKCEDSLVTLEEELNKL